MEKGEIKMKCYNKYSVNGILFLIAMMLSVSFVAAESFEINLIEEGTYRTSSANIKINQLKYEPYPVNPGEYLTLWIKAENIGRELTESAIFELVPKYPFSLDSNEDPVRNYGQLSSEEPIVMEYKVRVSKNAVEGTNEIELRYKTDSNDDSWRYEEFEIVVEDAQTDFDLVIQEINGDEVSIAIANTGKNIAYSVIVRIPEQEEYQTVGTNGQMVGNLEDGDYTLVGFEIQKKSRTSEEPLKIQIDYTDNIGERRSMIKDVDFDTGTRELPEGVTREQFVASGMRGMMQMQQQSIYQKWWFWAIVIVLVYAGWKGYKKYKRKKEQKEEKKTKK